jgi:uncharacterized membrane protein
MSSLIAATALFLGLHALLSGSPLRAHVVARTGEPAFKAGFSLAIALSLAWMAWAYSHAPLIPTWRTATGLQPLALGLVLLGFLLFAASLAERNPTTLGLLLPDQVEARGTIRITRHPGLFGLGLWGLAHFIVNGDWASHLLFGSFAFQGLVAPLNLDRKYRQRHGATWDTFARQTSYVPFVAILQGRNRLVWRELSWLAIVLGLLGFTLAAALHARVVGAPAF